MKRPLEGITVIGLEQVIAGPFCTRQLAELGARVIKIERPGVGDAARDMDGTVLGQSSHFVWVNRSKESIALDVKHPDAKPVLEKLLAKADVFIQNLAPGAAERLGLGAEQLRAKYPRLIWCGISGYGPAGPYAEKRAYDLLVQCEAGLLSVTGTEQSPSKAGVAIADIASGMYAMSSILAALLRREKTGEGATLDITMFESLAEWMGFPAYFAHYSGTPPARSGAYHATIVPYGPFATAAGGTVFFSVQNEREFERFCSVVLEKPGLAKDPRFDSNPARVRNREAMHAEIEACFARFSSQEIISRLEKANIANAQLNTMEQFWNHPQLKARERWREVGSPAGPIQALKPPFNLDAFEPRMDAIPALGEQTGKILREIGYSEREIERLAGSGAVRLS